MPHGDTRRLATAADIAELERHEVVDGELVQKASPTAWHSYAQGELLVTIRGLLGSRPAGWWILPECTIELAPHEVYQPDIAGWRTERMPDLPETFPVRVAPDWVCEVLSPSTAGRDLGHKLRAYHGAHVQHYWVVDTHNRTLAILRWHEAAYALVVTAGAGDIVQPEPFNGQLTLAQDDGAIKDILKLGTHGRPRRDAIDDYTSLEWTTLCREVQKLTIVRRHPGRGQVIAFATRPLPAQNPKSDFK